MREGGSTISGYTPPVVLAEKKPQDTTTTLENKGTSSNSVMTEYLGTAASSIMSGGDVVGDLRNKAIEDLLSNLDEMGGAGKILHTAYNLLFNRKGAAQTAQVQTQQHGQLAVQAQATQKTTFTANIQAIVDLFTTGDSLRSLAECKNEITNAISQIQDKEAAKEKLIEEKDKLEQENVQLQKDIEDLGGQLYELLTKEETGEELSPEEKDLKQTLLSQFQEKVGTYTNNTTMLQALMEQIEILNGGQIEDQEGAKEKEGEVQEGQQAAEQEIEDDINQGISDFRSQISSTYSAFAPILGNDEKAHKLYQNIDKALYTAQLAAAATASMIPGVGSTASQKFLREAAQNKLAEGIDKLGNELGIKNLGSIATGKVSLEEFVTTSLMDQGRATMTSALKDITGDMPVINDVVSTGINKGMKTLTT